MANVFLQFPALVQRFGIVPRHLVHVGAHEGQEVPYYRAAGVGHITLVEPIPELAEKLRADHPDAHVIEAACGSTVGTATLHIPRRSNMATLTTPGPRDGRTRAVTVTVLPLSQIQADAEVPPNIAVIDAQGRELDVLNGADLGDLDLVIVETVTVRDDTMASHYPDVVAHMADAGFVQADAWARDQDWVAQWARGKGQPRTGGQVLDVAFVKVPS